MFVVFISIVIILEFFLFKSTKPTFEFAFWISDEQKHAFPGNLQYLDQESSLHTETGISRVSVYCCTSGADRWVIEIMIFDASVSISAFLVWLCKHYN